MGETLWYRYMYQINCGWLPRHFITDCYAFHMGLWFTILLWTNWRIYVFYLKYNIYIWYCIIHVHLSWTSDYNNLVRMGKRGGVGVINVWTFTTGLDLSVKKIKVVIALSTWIKYPRIASISPENSTQIQHVTITSTR